MKKILLALLLINSIWGDDLVSISQEDAYPKDVISEQPHGRKIKEHQKELTKILWDVNAGVLKLTQLSAEVRSTGLESNKDKLEKTVYEVSGLINQAYNNSANLYKALAEKADQE
jgi:hypothetical protein